MKDLTKKFISFEGIDGSGKTTIIKVVAQELIKIGHDVIITREPGGSEQAFAENIRKIIFEAENINTKTELLLFEASRSEHLEKVIIPKIKEGKFVLCDRYVDSSIVYQGQKGLIFKDIDYLNHFSTNNFYPHITFLFDLNPKIAITRLANGDHKINRFDKELLHFHQGIRERYLELAKNNSERFVIIDVNRTMDLIVNDILKIIEERS